MAEMIPEGKMLVDGELVDAYENCDGAEPAYLCSYPPCVAEREAEAAHWAAVFAAAPPAVTIALDDDAYEPGDPKRSDFLDRIGA